MGRGDIISGAAFKAMVRAALLFLLILVVMALFSLRLIDRAMTGEVRLRVEEMAMNIGRSAVAHTDTGLARWVEGVTGGAAGTTLAYALFDADGARIAGNTTVHPAPGAWLETRVALELPAHAGGGGTVQDYLMHAVPVDELTLVVGLSTAHVGEAQRAAIRAFALTGFVIVLAMLAIGYVLSQRTQRALEDMSDALDRVSQGETGARIALSGRNDQIDRISRQINAHLDQLDGLFGQTRRTATAVAHDLRRPLARAVLGMERALARVAAGADARDEIEQSIAELGSLQNVIATILRIARIERGDVGTMGATDLRDVLDEVAETFGPVAEDAAQRLDYVRAPVPLTVRGDGEMLAQLVVNLVQNAITHAGDGARIALTAEPGPEGIVLAVADDGPGIPRADRERVFEPFFRIDDARSIDGNGMGLALVKAIAERHDARLRLEDAQPGLRVTVTFPAPQQG